LIQSEMESLHFDEVWQDAIGNVNGRIYGRERDLPALVLNTHLDHVDPGDPALWPVDPYGGAIVAGADGERIVGRGASDIKGPLAVQVYGMAGLLQAGERPRRDVVFSGVVEEEVGGAGAIHWIQHLDYPVALILLGEPSSNELALGHRGMLSVWVTFPGRSVHASVPARGENPNYALATFLSRLREQQATLSHHPILGKSTVAPTIVEVDTRSKNVTPAWTRVLLDFRTSAESPASIQRFVREVAGDLPYALSAGYESIPLTDSETLLSGFYTPPESEVVRKVRAAIATGTGQLPALSNYRFATDGRHFEPYGLPILGYSPGDEEQAHIAGESISIAKMAESLQGHMELLRSY
jgi:acetylornithine deacetylase/succinyl-diaminopimelate desuccinylase-like protein